MLDAVRCWVFKIDPSPGNLSTLVQLDTYRTMYSLASAYFISSQQQVTGQVRMMVYKGNVYVRRRSSDTSNLYDKQDASMDSMDSLEGFSPSDSIGFIEISALRLKKYGLRRQKDGQPLI
jgi:argininosuccinate synthase